MLLFFTGLLLRWVDIPKYWRWFSYINFLRYSWGSLMKNQFEGSNDVEVRRLAVRGTRFASIHSPQYLASKH